MGTNNKIIAIFNKENINPMNINQNGNAKEEIWQSVVNRALANINGELPLEISKINQKTNLVAIGDIHGALGSFVQQLFIAGYVDKNGHWIANNKTLIQMGDLVDRGPHSLETYKYLKHLQAEAKASGGKVIILLGNHELFYAQNERCMALANGGDWAKDKKLFNKFRQELIQDIIDEKITASYSDGTSLFTHAGLHPDILTSFPEINKKNPGAISDFLNNALKDNIRIILEKESNYKINFAENIKNPKIFQIGESRGGRKNQIGGIFWADAFFDMCKLENQLTNFSQVFAHTPTVNIIDDNNESYKGIFSFANGHYLNIDTGLTPVYNGCQAFLAIGQNGRYEIKNTSEYFDNKTGDPKDINLTNWQARKLSSQ